MKTPPLLPASAQASADQRPAETGLGSPRRPATPSPVGQNPQRTTLTLSTTGRNPQPVTNNPNTIILYL
jgi:hypothetical protein